MFLLFLLCLLFNYTFLLFLLCSLYGYVLILILVPILVLIFALQGLVGEQELATQVILLSAYSILFTVAFSISIGANIRVGNLLGAGDSIGARKAAVCALRLALASATLIAVGLGLGREYWPRLYGASDGVMARIVQLAPLYAAAQVRIWGFSQEGGGYPERMGLSIYLSI